MIYVPEIYLDNCNVIYDGYIRSFDDDLINYTDIFINQDYMTQRGVLNLEYSGLCSDVEFTSNYYYRVDFVNILLMFFIICLFSIYIPIKIFSRLFKKGGI